jgi:hypothetical protein
MRRIRSTVAKISSNSVVRNRARDVRKVGYNHK